MSMRCTTLLILISIAGYSFAHPHYYGGVPESTKHKIFELFENGAELYAGGAFVRRLPKGLGQDIEEVRKKSKSYRVHVRTGECKAGNQIFDVRYVCSVEQSSCSYQVQDTGQCAITLE